MGREAERRPDAKPKVNDRGIEELVTGKGYHSGALVGRVKLPVPLPQTRVLGPGCYIDGNVAVGVFPECEEVFVGCERSAAGGGIRPL